MRFLAAILGVFILMGGIAYGLFVVTNRHEEVIEKVTVIAAPEEGPLTGAISDDLMETKVKRRLNFEQDLTYAEKYNGATVNLSEAVLKVGLDPVDPETETEFAKTYKSFKDAAEAGWKVKGASKESVLPSASLLFHKARELDSGVLATLDLAMVNGTNDTGIGLLKVVEDIFNSLEKTDNARAYLAAALELAGKPVEVFPEEVARRNIWVTRYKTQRREVYPPIDYYAWNKELERVYDFETFLQEEIPRRQWFMAAQISRALNKEQNKTILNAYQAILNGFDFLYMPRRSFTVEDLTRITVSGDESIMEMFRKRPGMQYRIVFLNPAWRREQIHFGEMMPLGVVSGLDPFSELTQRSMIGFVSFVPQSGRPGVEQFHALALDSLMAEHASLEADKMLLSRVYRERLFHPYYATKREVFENEVSGLITASPWKPSDEGKLCPTLRIEPVPQYYIRSARAYHYMRLVMQLILGEKTASTIRRVLPDGSRHTEPLVDEVDRMKRLFYGAYIITCEDLGIRPSFEVSDTIDVAKCREEAINWLGNAFNDKDAVADSRYMSPPIFVRPGEKNRVDQMVMTWSNIGVRLDKLNVSYAHPPQLKPEGENTIWSTADTKILGTGRYILPVVNFRILELVSRGGLETKQFREICDKADQDPDKITAAILEIEPPALSRIPNEEAVNPQDVYEKSGSSAQGGAAAPLAPANSPTVKPPKQ